MRQLATLLMVIAACGDDYGLQIVAEMPDNEAYKALITKTVVTVYESELDPSSLQLTCEQIEFGDVTDDLLLGAAVAQQTVMKGGGTEGTLDDISRVGRKLVVARMYGDNDVLIAAGCTEQGDIGGDVKIVVKTIVAATVAIDNVVEIEDPYGKSVTIVDPLGSSIEGRSVRWRLFAPGGATPDSMSGVTIDPTESTIWEAATPSCTSRGGVATVRLTPPSRVLGFASRFRVSWPATPLSPSSGFVRPHVGLALLSNPPASNRCAIRTAGERRVVCIADANGAARAERFQVMPFMDNPYALRPGGTPVPITGKPIGVVSIDEAGGKEAYAVLETGSIVRLFGSTTPAAVTCANCTIDDVRVIPACGQDPARLVMRSTTGGTTAPIRVVPAVGGTATDFALPADLNRAGLTVNLNTAGCVTTISPTGEERDVQVVVLDFSSLTDGRATRAVFRCGAGICSVALPFPEAGVGFLKAGTATKPEMQLVGTAFDVGGAELIGWVLRATMDGFVLIDRQRFTAASAPSQILVGRLDNDNAADLLWNIRGNRSALLQVSYGHELPDGSRLSALAPVVVPVDEIALGDLTGDGFDDVVGVTPGSVVVLPQNVDGPVVDDATNETPTCAP